MSFDFTENVTLVLPDVHGQFTPFTESADFRQENKLIIEIAAIHAGLTSNYNNYPADALEAALSTWVMPYPKPIIVNHDEKTEPIGRVMAARMDTEESDGTPYARLQVAILDPVAVEKVMDRRYMTGSIGGSANSAQCSICEVDWAKANLEAGPPCRHKRGKVYEGKLAYFNLGELSFREYSFVNIPADQNSSVLAVSNTNEEGEDVWTHSVKIFALDMNKQSVVEMNESAGNKNILESMKRKDATATYMNLKGSILLVNAYDCQENDTRKSEILETPNTIYNELNSEEKHMAKDVVEANEDDVLAVSEQLSTDLAATATESETSDEAGETEELPQEGAETDPEKPAEEEEEEKPEDVVAADKQLDEPKPEGEGEEVEQAKDVAAEAGTTEGQEGQEDGEVETPPSRESAELEAEVEKLKTENEKLRSALKTMLVERVVDAKIAAGVEEADSRATLIEEHSSRTASSLKDSLLDLSKYPTKTREAKPEVVIESIEQKAAALGDESQVVAEAFEAPVSEEDKEKMRRKALEERFTGVLMGRTSL